MTQSNYPPPRGVKLVGMTTGGKVQEERGGAQINEYLFWCGFLIRRYSFFCEVIQECLMVCGFVIDLIVFSEVY